MVDPSTLISAPLVKEAEKAGVEIAKAIRGRRDRDAALLLSNSRLVVYSMTAYANECRKTYIPLLRFTDKWSQARRERVWKAVEQFGVVHEIYPILERALPSIRRYVASLTGGALSGPRKRFEGQTRVKAASTLLDSGEHYLNEVMFVIRSGKFYAGPPTLQFDRGWFFGQRQSTEVVERAMEILKPLNDPGQALIDRANAAYAELEDDILRRRKNLLDWRKLTLQGFQTRL